MGKGFPGKDAKFQGQVRLDCLLPAEWIYAERIHPFGGQTLVLYFQASGFKLLGILISYPVHLNGVDPRQHSL